MRKRDSTREGASRLRHPAQLRMAHGTGPGVAAPATRSPLSRLPKPATVIIPSAPARPANESSSSSPGCTTSPLTAAVIAPAARTAGPSRTVGTQHWRGVCSWPTPRPLGLQRRLSARSLLLLDPFNLVFGTTLHAAIIEL
jgi:hypothetical protein